MTMANITARRENVLGPNVPTFYDTPVHLVRGQGVWVWDAQGRKYLDCYNNVPHVGHCHPRVVQAITDQASTLNTHTRYLHETILDYGEQLTATFGHDLSQMLMVVSGSEANDVALRMAQAVTGHDGFIATDNTYHGNTTAVSQLSARKPPIGGRASNIRLIPAPNSVDPVGGDLDTQPQAIADELERAIHDLKQNGHGFAGFMFCPIFANEGFPTIGPGWMDPIAQVVKRHGGLLLCDEVQPGFGRTGTGMWGHDMLGISPDVVTMGKPMANGHPCAAVVTRPDVMAAFRNAFGFFSTFGGNPVSCAAALATLNVIQDEKLVENAARVGAHALARLNAIDHPLKAQARGAGLFFGIEFIHPDGTPATKFVARVVEAMLQRGVLMNKIGRHGNTLKMRPPMPFSAKNADFALDALQDALGETPHD